MITFIILLTSPLVRTDLATGHNPGLIVKETYTPENPPCNLKMDNFSSLVYFSDVLIDKSLLIKDFLEDTGTVYLITYPRGWGKTTNIDMIKTFLEIQTDEFGEPILPINSTSNYRLFMNGTSNFDGKTKQLKNPLLISKYKDIVRKYLGKYPVLYVPLDEVLKYEYNKTIEIKLWDLFEPYNYLLTPYREVMRTYPATSQDYIRAKVTVEFFESYKTAETFEVPELKEGILFLCEVLYNHFHRKVFLIVDNYDIWKEIITKPMSATDYEFIKVYEDIMNYMFSFNIYLKKGIMIGRQPAPCEFRLLKPTNETDTFRKPFLANVIECNLLTDKFTRYFGFNKLEIDLLFDQLRLAEGKKQQITYRYNGYRPTGNLQIYNPWSVMNFLKTYKIFDYWVELERQFLQDVLSNQAFSKKLHSLINGQDITVEFQWNRFTFKDFQRIFNMQKEKLQNDDCFVDIVFGYLYLLGYLTLSENQPRNNFMYCLIIPNDEILDSIKKLYQESEE